MSTGDVAQLVGALQTAATRLVEVDVAALSDAALLEALAALRPVVCQVQAAETRLVGAVHCRGAAGLDGAVSTSAWLRNRLRVGDATVKVRSAAVLDRLPGVAAAFAAGQINDAHVAVIAKVAADISDEAMHAGAEKLLVEQARELAPTKFTQVATRIRDHLDPDAADRRRRNRLTDRWLHADRTFDGAVAVTGLLDPDAGELLLTTLAALMPPPRPDDTRTASQRRADALLDLCRLAANHSPVAGGEKPHVLVTVDLATLRTQLTHTDDRDSAADCRGTGGDAPIAASSTGALLGSGWTIGPDTARRLACDAGIIPLLLGGPAEPLDIADSPAAAHPRCAERWCSATAAAATPTATGHPNGATPTTSATGPAADLPACLTVSCSAGPTTPSSTNTATPSPLTPPPARSPCANPGAYSPPRAALADPHHCAATHPARHAAGSTSVIEPAATAGHSTCGVLRVRRKGGSR
jgi:hypothetical protein